MPNEKRDASYDSLTNDKHSSPSIKRPGQDLSESEPESVPDSTLEARFLKRLYTELTEGGDSLLQLLHSPKEKFSRPALSLCIEFTFDALGAHFLNLLTKTQLECFKNAPRMQKHILSHFEHLPEKQLTDLKHLYTGFLETESNFDLECLFQSLILAEKKGSNLDLIHPSLSTDATVKSWSRDYTGKAHESFWFHVEKLCEDFTSSNVEYYAKYSSIIQSSGMGKSRLVDEMSKTHFTIPFCLRHDQSEGFPPADIDVRNYLTQAKEEAEANRNAQAFLTSAFIKAIKWINNNFSSRDVSIRQVAYTFRTYMSKDQKFEKPNENRENFFRSVVDLAKELSPEDNGWRPDDSQNKTSGPVTPQAKYVQVRAPDSPDHIITWKPSTDLGSLSKMTIIDAAKSLEDALLKFKQDDWKPSSPIIILSFDEAHTLSTVVKAANVSASSPTHFSCLRRALRKIRHQAIFSVFLSTTGQVFQFTPPRGLDSSARVTRFSGLKLMPPYTDLGYDMLAEHAVEGQTTMEDVMRLGYLVKLGRPLFATRYAYGAEELRGQIVIFAAQKLTKMDDLSIINSNNILHEDALLACLMCRLGLDFNRWSYEARKREMRHVEDHMRVCLKAEPSFDGVHTISPSEPILAEGAKYVMQKFPFNAASVLSNEYRRPEVERGPRGEAIFKLLVILATDMVATAGHPEAWSVPAFLQKLCGSPSSQGVFVCDVLDALPSCVHPNSGITLETRLRDAFKNSKMNMNHFARAGNSAVLNRNFIWRRIPRRAGVECALNQPRIDGVIPITYYNEALGRYNVTFIMYQVKNNIEYGSKVDPLLFDDMDPYLLRLFSKNDKDYSIGCIPIIRIVVALSSDHPTVVNLSSQTSQRKLRGDRKSYFTTYDLWFSGLNHHIWGPIKEQEETSWKELLDASGRSIPEVFRTENPTAAKLRQFQAPCMFDDEQYSSQFIKEDSSLELNLEIRGYNNAM